ncbi:transient-receptor-potential-like protein [Symsagittifera roscoffensis]|uniref:transient-receptor-potential-like protein n=1 Tax=Symsagittifera roscoffensis TaxID=84072 RepID=UPI00307B180C
MPSFATKFRLAGNNQEIDPSEIAKKLRQDMIASLSLPNPVDNLDKLIQKSIPLQEMFSLNFRDKFGYTLLGNAVKLFALPVIQYLVLKRQFIIKEELIIAVDVDYRAAIEFFLSVDPELVDRPVLTGTVYRPGLSPVMVAALRENETMLKFLFSRGAQHLDIPNYDPREPRNIIRFDAICQTLLALSNPMYLCIMNEDPIMVAFKISERCQQISSSLTVAATDMQIVKESCEKFAAEFISNIATFDELMLVMNQMTTLDHNIVAPGEPWERLKYAISNKHTEFVANGSIQKLMKKKFYEGPIALQDFESSNIAKKAAYLLVLVLLTPAWIFFYLFVPATTSPTAVLESFSVMVAVFSTSLSM